jgi:hypothetical protein
VDTTEVSDKDDVYISIMGINTVTDMNNGWQYDTGASTHTTNLKHRLIEAKKTKIMVTGVKLLIYLVAYYAEFQIESYLTFNNQLPN